MAQGDLLYKQVTVGIVDEHAGLHIALGVDGQIVTSAGDAAAHFNQTTKRKK